MPRSRASAAGRPAARPPPTRSSGCRRSRPAAAGADARGRGAARDRGRRLRRRARRRRARRHGAGRRAHHRDRPLALRRPVLVRRLRMPWHRPLRRYGRGYWGRTAGPCWRPTAATAATAARATTRPVLRARGRRPDPRQAIGEPLYEARAKSEGPTTGADSLLPAMFIAAMKDFPAAARPTAPRHGRDDHRRRAVQRPRSALRAELSWRLRPSARAARPRSRRASSPPSAAAPALARLCSSLASAQLCRPARSE